MSDSVQSDLFRKTLQGDPDALGALLERLRPYVQTIVRSMRNGRPTGAAGDSDLIQDVLLQAVRSAHTFQGGTLGEWIAWLKTITVRTTHRTFHGTAVSAAVHQDSSYAATQIIDTGLDPRDAAARQEESACMALALSRLPEEMQQVLQFRLLDELDHAAIADRMGRSPGAVRMLYLRSLRRLRAIWSDEFEP